MEKTSVIAGVHYVKPGQFAFAALNFSPYSCNWHAAPLGTIPAFINVTTTLKQGIAQYWFTAPNTPGQTYYIPLAVFEKNVTGPVLCTAVVKIVVQNSFDIEVDNCCGGNMMIVWLNREGGMQNYFFTGVRTFEMRAGDIKRFTDSTNITRYSQRGRVYRGMVLTTGPISKAEADMLDSLQYSIQAYHIDPELIGLSDQLAVLPLPGQTRHILLDNQSYTKYKTRDKFYEVSIKFIYAEPVTVQGQ